MSIAAFSCASLSLFAIVSLNLVIFTLSSGPCLIFRSEGEGLDPIKLMISSFKIRPFLPEPSIVFKSTLASLAIFLAAGETCLSTFREIFSSCTCSKINGSSSSNLRTGSCFFWVLVFFALRIFSSSKIFGLFWLVSFLGGL